LDHPSSSKQHAVIQFRQICSTNEFGDSKNAVKFSRHVLTVFTHIHTFWHHSCQFFLSLPI
jgi:hypothetical protein